MKGMPVLSMKTETSKTLSIITKISMVGLGVFESIRSIYPHRNIKTLITNRSNLVIPKLPGSSGKMGIQIWEVIGIHRHSYLSELFNSIFNKVILIRRFGNLWATLD